MEFKRKVWDVEWEIDRSGEIQVEQKERRFRTFEGAQNKVREQISQINLTPYLQKFRKGVHSSYRNAMAEYIEKLLSSGAFFESKKDIPSLSPEDYPPDIYNKYRNLRIWRNDSENKIDDPEIDNEDIPFVIKMNPDYKDFVFKYQYEACPRIHTDIVILDNNETKYDISFSFQFEYLQKEKLEKGQLSSLKVTLHSCIEKNKARYSAQILELLKRSNEPLKQHEIADILGVDRKTVWRNIGALVEAGIKIEEDEHNAYYLSQTGDRLSYEDINIIKKSIVLNPNISSEEKERLMELLSRM